MGKQFTMHSSCNMQTITEMFGLVVQPYQQKSLNVLAILQNYELNKIKRKGNVFPKRYTKIDLNISIGL